MSGDSKQVGSNSAHDSFAINSARASSQASALFCCSIPYMPAASRSVQSTNNNTYHFTSSLVIVVSFGCLIRMPEPPASTGLTTRFRLQPLPATLLSVRRYDSADSVNAVIMLEKSGVFNGGSEVTITRGLQSRRICCSLRSRSASCSHISAELISAFSIVLTSLSFSGTSSPSSKTSLGITASPPAIAGDRSLLAQHRRWCPACRCSSPCRYSWLTPALPPNYRSSRASPRGETLSPLVASEPPQTPSCA